MHETKGVPSRTQSYNGGHFGESNAVTDTNNDLTPTNFVPDKAEGKRESSCRKNRSKISVKSKSTPYPDKSRLSDLTVNVSEPDSEHNHNGQIEEGCGIDSLNRTDSVASAQISDSDSFNSHEFYINNPSYGRMDSGENSEAGIEDSPGGSSAVSFCLEQQNNRYNDLISNHNLCESDRQSLKHLSASAPAMRTDLAKGDEFFMPPSSSKSRQKKFHRHFKTIPPEEKVLDYYSCALVGDILLQGFLYISENYFAFYSNVFGYVTKLLIPITTVVKITKERTAKIFPNAVGIETQSERHVFASLISRDTTFKLMCKVWMHHTKTSDTLIIPKDSIQGFDDTNGDLAIVDDSSSGSGNDSALEHSSCSPSPQSTPGPGLQNLLHHAKLPNNNNNVIAHNISQLSAAQLDEANLKMLASVGLSPTYLRLRTGTHRGAGMDNSNTTIRRGDNQSMVTNSIKGGAPSGPGKSYSLLILATVLLVILFISAALLLLRISNLQQKLSERPGGGNSEQFYQDLITWQNRLHSNSAEEIHQFIDTNLQQIVKVRESLEALSTIFMNGQHNSIIGDQAHFGNRER